MARLCRAYYVLKNTTTLLGLSHENDSKTLEEKILRMILMLRNESLNLVAKIFGYNKLVLPFSICKDFVLKYCKLNNYVYVSNTKSFVMHKRSQLRIFLELFINWVGHISLINVEINQVEICAPLLFNTLMYGMRFVDVINYEDEPFIMPKNTKLVKLNFHKSTADVIFLQLPAVEMKRSWDSLQWYEYDLEKNNFLQRLTTGITKALKQDSPVELDLSEHVSGCNVISLGRCINTKKKVLYNSFASRIMNKKKQNTANSILVTQYWMRQFLTSREVLEKFQSCDRKIIDLKKRCTENNGRTIYRSDVFVLDKKILYFIKKLFNKNFRLLVLPAFPARLVLNHLHFSRRLHISTSQLARVFLMNFYCFDLQTLSQEVCDSCLPCTTNREAFKNHRELGPQKSLMIAKPNYSYQANTAYMPPNNGFNYLWVMVDEVLLYTALFPLRDLSVTAVCKCIDKFLTLMPKFTILKTDYGGENSKALTKHLAQYNILHWNSIQARSAQQGLVERHIRSVKTLVNKIIAKQSTMNRCDWVKIISWVAQCINKTEVHASGLSRYDLLFSPFITDHTINWGDFDYGIQQRIIKNCISGGVLASI